MKREHSLWLLLFIIVGVIAGLFVGWYWGKAATGVAWLGKLFLNTLSMLVIPLLVSAVISGVTSLGDVRQLGRISAVMGITLDPRGGSRVNTSGTSPSASH